MHVARLGAVGEHVLEHAGDDLADDLGKGEEGRRARGHRGALALRVRSDGGVQRVVLVQLLGVGGGVVEDIYRMPWRHLGGAVDEGLASGVRRPAVGGPDAELVIGRVGVGLGGVGPHRGDPGRREGRVEVGILLPGQLVGVLHGRGRPAGRHRRVQVGHAGRRLRGVRSGVGEGEFLLAGAGGGVGGRPLADRGRRGRARVGGAVVGQRCRAGRGVGADLGPAGVGSGCPVNDVVRRVADGLPHEGHRPGRPGHRDGGDITLLAIGHVGLGLVGAGGVRPVELVGHRVLVRARCQRPAGAAGVRLVQVGRVDRRRGARIQVGEAGVVARYEHLRVVVAVGVADIGRRGQAETAGAGYRSRCSRRIAGVLVQLGLDVVLRRAAHVEVGGVVGVAQPAEVIRVGLAGGEVGRLELRQQGVRAAGTVVDGIGGGAACGLPGQVQLAVLVLDSPPVVEQLVHPERRRRHTRWPRARVVFLSRIGPVCRGDHVGGIHAQRVRVGIVVIVHRDAPRVVWREGVIDVHLDVVAVQAQMGVLSHPVDESRRQQQPLELAGVVIEVER